MAAPDRVMAELEKNGIVPRRPAARNAAQEQAAANRRQDAERKAGAGGKVPHHRALPINGRRPRT